MSSQENVTKNLRDDFKALKDHINSNKFSTFLSFIKGIKNLKVSFDEKNLIISVQDNLLIVYNIRSKKKVTDIEVEFKLRDFCDSSSYLFVCGKGIHLYKDYKHSKSILQQFEFRSLAVGSGALFALTSESLFKIDLETHLKTAEISKEGKYVYVNPKFVVIFGLDPKLIVFNYDLVQLFEVEYTVRYSKMQLLSNNFAIIGGNFNQLEIYDLNRKKLHCEYRSLKKIVEFCATEDSQYLTAFDNELLFFNIKDKFEEFRIKVTRNRQSIGGHKELSSIMCYSKSGKKLFVCISETIIEVNMYENYYYPFEKVYPCGIKELTYDTCLTVKCEDDNLYTEDIQIVENKKQILTCPSPMGIYTTMLNKVQLNGVSCTDMLHSTNVVSIKHVSNCTVSIDESFKFNIKTPSKHFSQTFSAEVQFLGMINNHLFYMNNDLLEIYDGTKLITPSKKVTGTLLFCHKAEKFFIFENWKVSVYETPFLESFIEIEANEAFTEPIYFCISEDDLFLYISTKTCITFWSLYDYKYIGKIELENIDKVLVCKSNIYVSSNDKLYTYPNPLSPEQPFTLLMPDQYSLKYWFALKEIISDVKLISYKAYLNNCTIIPMCCNILHIFTHQLQASHIQKAIKEGCCFIRTNRRMSPIAIAHEQRTFNIIDYYLQSFNLFLDLDKNSLYRAEDDLININKIASTKLILFYKSIMTSPKKQLPKFGIPKVKGKHIIVVNSSNIDVNSFVDKTDESKNKTSFTHNLSLEFKISALRLPLNIGSSGSMNFLHSILTCKTQEIFATPIIKSILNYKWQRIYYWMLVEGILLAFLLILLNFYIIINRNEDIFIAILVLNTLFLIYEGLQASIGFFIYIRSFWNKIDTFRILCIYLLYIRESLGEIPEKFLMSFIILVIWTRVISFFSIFRPTRYLIYIIKECTKDTIPFLIIMFYLTLAFAITFFNLQRINEKDEVKHDFMSAWTHSYLLNFCSFDTKNYDEFQWVLFIIATLINPLVLMNMIIALLGNTYSRVKENAQIADLRELAEMILEVESILIINRNNNRPKYVQICASAEKIEDPELTNLSTLVKCVSSRIPIIKDSITRALDNKNLYLQDIDLVIQRNKNEFSKELEKFETSMEDDHKNFIEDLIPSLIK